ncbi:MAG TPA: choice-of-anchor tandem repeat GloVer-containing protein [Methylomirabilota bacterium]|nr:choice-of-anchor tandem repeat GloVer-containing protein [Methylomirabilota bacterium]
MEGADGWLYGTTHGGGAGSAGTLFKVRSDGSQYRVLREFGITADDARHPRGELTQGHDEVIYATTEAGGEHGAGALVRLDPDGGGYRVLRSFGASDIDGADPGGGVIMGSDGWLYGVTRSGGRNGFGTIYKIATDGEGYTILRHLGEDPFDGRWPDGHLVEGADGVLYGVTTEGGRARGGTLFRLDADGAHYSILWHFSASGDDTANPVSIVEGTGGQLFGTGASGGLFNSGTVFRLSRSGTEYSIIKDFGASPEEGMAPLGGVTEVENGLLYGTTAYGGAFGFGTVFQVAADGGSFRSLHHFRGGPSDGANPESPLTRVGANQLAGVTPGGGPHQAGTIFRINQDGSGYIVLRAFTTEGGDGQLPQGRLVEGNDGRLYGTTLYGGAFGAGTIYRITTNGSGFAALHSFGGPPADGATPHGGLMLASDGRLYGTTAAGGVHNVGTVFAIRPDGTGYTVIRSFLPDGAEARFPLVGLLEGPEGALYGTTVTGGAEGFGALFKVNKDGTGYRVLHSFVYGSGGDSANPGPLLLARDGMIYGNLFFSGTHGYGSIYRWNVAGLPRMSAARAAAGVTIRIETFAGLGCVLESRDHGAKIWQPVVAFTNASGRFEYVDPKPTAPARLYRARAFTP